MNATCISQDLTNTFRFEVEFEGNNHTVTIYVNQKGKFIDWEFEGDVDDDLGDAIIEYIDKNWTKLTGQF